MSRFFNVVVAITMLMMICFLLFPTDAFCKSSDPRSFVVNNVKFENDTRRGRHALLPVIPLAEKISTLASTRKRNNAKPICNLIGRSAHSAVAENNVNVTSYMVKHPFIDTVVLAFDQHRPLTLKPIHFWMLITRAVAKHVFDNSNELKGRFLKNVTTEEKKIRLEVFRDKFSAEFEAQNDWAGVVTEFNDQMKEHLLDDVLNSLSPDFSLKTQAEDIALKVTIMDTMQKFFEYTVVTGCGFPKITLLGTLRDWELLLPSARHLISTKCTPEFSTKWLPTLESVLFKLEETAKILHAADTDHEKIDRVFWSSFCKMGGRDGSGSNAWINGWITAFFPNVNRGDFLEPYSQDIWYAQQTAPPRDDRIFNEHEEIGDENGVAEREGIDVDDFDNGLSTAPVDWNYFGEEIDLEFKSGFIATKVILGEDVESGADGVMPEVGWWIQKKPDKVIEYNWDDDED